jgi:hypothetical protein
MGMRRAASLVDHPAVENCEVVPADSRIKGGQSRLGVPADVSLAVRRRGTTFRASMALERIIRRRVELDRLT